MGQQKCAVCSYRVWSREAVVFAHGDLMHEVCFKLLTAQQTLRDSRTVILRSRDLIEKAREAVIRQRALQDYAEPS